MNVDTALEYLKTLNSHNVDFKILLEVRETLYANGKEKSYKEATQKLDWKEIFSNFSPRDYDALSEFVELDGWYRKVYIEANKNGERVVGPEGNEFNVWEDIGGKYILLNNKPIRSITDDKNREYIELGYKDYLDEKMKQRLFAYMEEWNEGKLKEELTKERLISYKLNELADILSSSRFITEFGSGETEDFLSFAQNAAKESLQEIIDNPKILGNDWEVFPAAMALARQLERLNIQLPTKEGKGFEQILKETAQRIQKEDDILNGLDSFDAERVNGNAFLVDKILNEVEADKETEELWNNIFIPAVDENYNLELAQVAEEQGKTEKAPEEASKEKRDEYWASLTLSAKAEIYRRLINDPYFAALSLAEKEKYIKEEFSTQIQTDLLTALTAENVDTFMNEKVKEIIGLTEDKPEEKRGEDFLKKQEAYNEKAAGKISKALADPSKQKELLENFKSTILGDSDQKNKLTIKPIRFLALHADREAELKQFGRRLREKFKKTKAKVGKQGVILTQRLTNRLNQLGTNTYKKAYPVMVAMADFARGNPGKALELANTAVIGIGSLSLAGASIGQNLGLTDGALAGSAFGGVLAGAMVAHTLAKGAVYPLVTEWRNLKRAQDPAFKKANFFEKFNQVRKAAFKNNPDMNIHLATGAVAAAAWGIGSTFAGPIGSRIAVAACVSVGNAIVRKREYRRMKELYEKTGDEKYRVALYGDSNSGKIKEAKGLRKTWYKLQNFMGAKKNQKNLAYATALFSTLGLGIRGAAAADFGSAPQTNLSAVTPDNVALPQDTLLEDTLATTLPRDTIGTVLPQDTLPGDTVATTLQQDTIGTLPNDTAKTVVSLDGNHNDASDFAADTGKDVKTDLTSGSSETYTPSNDSNFSEHSLKRMFENSAAKWDNNALARRLAQMEKDGLQVSAELKQALSGNATGKGIVNGFYQMIRDGQVESLPEGMSPEVYVDKLTRLMQLAPEARKEAIDVMLKELLCPEFKPSAEEVKSVNDALKDIVYGSGAMKVIVPDADGNLCLKEVSNFGQYTGPQQMAVLDGKSYPLRTPNVTTGLDAEVDCDEGKVKISTTYYTQEVDCGCDEPTTLPQEKATPRPDMDKLPGQVGGVTVDNSAPEIPDPFETPTVTVEKPEVPTLPEDFSYIAEGRDGWMNATNVEFLDAEGKTVPMEKVFLRNEDGSFVVEGKGNKAHYVIDTEVVKSAQAQYVQADGAPGSEQSYGTRQLNSDFRISTDHFEAPHFDTESLNHRITFEGRDGRMEVQGAIERIPAGTELENGKVAKVDSVRLQYLNRKGGVVEKVFPASAAEKMGLTDHGVADQTEALPEKTSGGNKKASQISVTGAFYNGGNSR